MPVHSTTESGGVGLVLALALVLVLVLVPLTLASCSSTGSQGTQSTTGRQHTGSTSSAPRTEGRTTPSSSSSTTTTSGARGASGTREVTFVPYSPEGALLDTVIVTQTVSGTCVTPGVAGKSSYRCFAQPGSTVYDPCFAPPHAATGPLVCVADPALPTATRFQVGTLPTEPTSGPVTEPWAMRLANGQSCVLVAAAWDGLGPFACPTPAASGPSQADCHQPTRATPTWTAACQPTQSPSSPFHQEQVITVWK